MSILSRKSEALSKYERCQDRVNKLRRTVTEAKEVEHVAAEAHAAALEKLERLPEQNTLRIAGNLELIPVAPIKAEIEEAANVLAARGNHRAYVEHDLKEALRDVEAARIAEVRERFKNALSGRLLEAIKELLSAADVAETIRREGGSEFTDLGMPFVTQATKQLAGNVEHYLNPPPPAIPKNLVSVRFTRSFSEGNSYERNRIVGRFNPGEVAGVTREQADRLFNLGVAERVAA
jgi:hypothetical protein